MAHRPAVGSVSQPDGEEVLTTQKASQGQATDCHLESRGEIKLLQEDGAGAQRPGSGKGQSLSPSPVEKTQPVAFPCSSCSPHLCSPAAGKPCRAPASGSHRPAPSPQRALAVCSRAGEGARPSRPSCRGRGTSPWESWGLEPPCSRVRARALLHTCSADPKYSLTRPQLPASPTRRES